MRSLLVPRFDSPQFKLVRDTEKKAYASVSNTLDITYRDKDSRAPVVVNTALFSVMMQLGVTPESSVTMYLEQDGARMVFGIVIDEEELYDLWHYTMDQLPPGLL